MSQVSKHTLEAQMAYNRKQYDTALQHSVQALQENPQEEAAHEVAALCHYQFDAYTKAVEHFEQCRRGCTAEPISWELYAISLSLIERAPEALKEFNQLLEKFPEHHNGYLNRAFCLLGLGKYADVFKDLLEAEQRGVVSEKIHFYRGVAHYNLKQFLNAIKSFDALLKVAPDYRDAAKIIADCYFTMGEFELAIHYYSMELYHHPDNVKARTQRVIARLNWKDAEGKLVQHQEAQEDVNDLHFNHGGFMSTKDKDGKPLEIVEIEVAPDGNVNLKVK